jgi:stress-induced morphogen
MVEPAALEQLIREKIEGVTHVAIEDLTGTKDHFQAVVVSPVFGVLTRVEQHQAVYRALGELMAGPVHALALQTYTPEKWASRSALGSMTKK